MSSLHDSQSQAYTDNANRDQTSQTKRNFLTTRNNSEIFGPYKQSYYSVIGPQDISDEYLKAAFEGDLYKLKQQLLNLPIFSSQSFTNSHLMMQYQIPIHSADKEEFWNKNMLAFFLAEINEEEKPNEEVEESKMSTQQQIRRNDNESMNSPDKNDHRKQDLNAPVLLDSSNDEFLNVKNIKKQAFSKTLKEQQSPRHLIQSSKEGLFDKKYSKTQIMKAPAKSFFQTEQDLVFMRHVFSNDFSRKFNSNILRIALNLTEDRVAAYIVARLPVLIDESVMNYAIQNKVLIFIHNVFFYKKNHLIQSVTKPSLNLDEYEDEISDIFTMEMLIAKINEYYDYFNSEEILSIVLKWKFEARENILKILCELGHERIAAKFMKDHFKYATKEFFYYCVVNEKAYFLKHALREQFFQEDYMTESQFIYTITTDLQAGQKILFNLNLLLFTDFKKWDILQLKDFISMAQSFLLTNLESSYMLQAYNPILAIALLIQYIKQIKYDFNVLDIECIGLIKKFAVLGRLIIENLKFDDIELIFMEKDFKDRSVLKIITHNEIMTFIVKSKLKYLLDKIWEGRYHSMVDGKISHFSRTQFLMNHSVRIAKGVETQFGDIIGANFKPNIDDYNFMPQMVFRQESITLILMKDFVCASIMVFVFQYINYLYLNLFTAKKYNDKVLYEDQIAVIQTSLNAYKQINFFGTILSCSYILNFVQRLIYNQFAGKKLDIDLWIVFDLTAGIANIIAFNIIGTAEPSRLLDQQYKWSLDYYMILVLVSSWLRYFSYFMIINPIAKVTLTLFKMLFETIPFFVILISYLCLMTTIFILLFKDAKSPDAYEYRNLLTTARQLISFFIGNYDTMDMGNYNTSHSILVIIHIVFSYIFLMNFLIAILSQVYESMIKNGDFYAIQYSYIFVTKYIKAIGESNGYEKLILFPPPLNFFLIPLILVSPSQSCAKMVSKYIGYFFFWLENCILIFIFMIYLIGLDLFIFVKTYVQIKNIDGVSHKLFYMGLWTLCGFPYLLYINLVDTCTLFNILCFEKSVSFNNEEEEKKKIIQHKFYIYRDCIRAIRQLYEVADDTTIIFNKKQKLEKIFTQRLSFREKLKKADNEQDSNDAYIVDKALIIHTYAQIAQHNKYILHYRQKYNALRKAKSNQSIFSNIDTSIITQREVIYSEPRISHDFKTFVSDMMMINKKDPSQIQEEERARILMQSQTESMTPDEAKLVINFLKKFEIVNKNQQNTSINLKVVCKCFPQIFNFQFVHKIELFNFAQMQKVLIKFYNDDKDEMFNYYDNRMKQRFNMVKINQEYNNQILEYIGTASRFIKDHHFKDGIYTEENQNIIRDFSFKKMSSPELNNMSSLFVPVQTRLFNLARPSQHIPEVTDSIQTEQDTMHESSNNTTLPNQRKRSSNIRKRSIFIKPSSPFVVESDSKTQSIKDDSNALINLISQFPIPQKYKQSLEDKADRDQSDNDSSQVDTQKKEKEPQSNKSQLETLKNTYDSQPNSFEFTLSNGHQVLADAQAKIREEMQNYSKKASIEKIERRMTTQNTRNDYENTERKNKIIQNYIQSKLDLDLQQQISVQKELQEQERLKIQREQNAKFSMRLLQENSKTKRKDITLLSLSQDSSSEDSGLN
ncbi:UNKNOWN [Stylonychia lemnae]|uniref:Ion transport domain-containing protein n=1 Tax=Stylonychia lemnae TaxID=5949 RepID=A0A078AVX2_STYLE|nr:UNKNOWN [Stylonychia lemnae]|eukprot:CDW85372.1 UNKNOWN [Stylonychia lemnae]